MPDQFEATGVIVDTSRDWSTVRVAIGHTLKHFSFDKAIFFTFGVRCDGAMNNILETGMEVNLSYELRSNQFPCVVAVWLGHKPISSEDSFALKPIYNQTGRVVRSGCDQLLVECDNGRETVLIEKQVIYHDGVFLKDDKLPPVENITFDAIPLNHKIVSGDFLQATYEATCAWTGVKEPRLVDRFGLRNEEEHELEDDLGFPDLEVHGTVAVIPNDIVALVDVDLNSVVCKVMLFRRSFTTDHSHEERLQDMVTAGDSLRLRIRKGYLFLGCTQWFAVTAWKCCVEIGANVKDEDSKGMALAGDGDVAAKDNKNNISPAASKSSVGPKETATADDPVKYDEFSEVLFGRPPLKGVIARTFGSAYISFGNLNIFVVMSDVFINKIPCSAAQFIELTSSGESIVEFEAILYDHGQQTEEKNSELKFTHVATCAWVGRKPTITSVASTFHQFKSHYLLEYENRTFRGVVFKYYLPKVAFVIVIFPKRNTTICLHISAFGCNPTNRDCARGEDCIVNFVKLGDQIECKVRFIPENPVMLCASDVKVLKKNAFYNMREDVEINNHDELAASRARCVCL